ncbi:hypothetical protein [Bartonella tamiae]
MQPASLYHSLWFHRKIDLDDWLFYDMKTSNLLKDRGLSHRSI